MATIRVDIDAQNQARRELNDLQRQINDLNRELAENRKAILDADDAEIKNIRTKNNEIRANQGLLRSQQQTIRLRQSETRVVEQAERQRQRANQQTFNAIRQFNRRFLRDAERVAREYVRDWERAERERERATREAQQTLTRFLQGTRDDFRRLLGPIRAIGRELLTVFAFTGTFLFADFARSIFDASLQIDSLQRSLTALLGTQRAANREIARLRELSELPGITFQGAARQFQSLLAVGFDPDRTLNIIQQFGNAAAISAVGVQELGRALTGLRQAFQRGSLDQENLGQITEAIPLVATALRQEFGSALAEDIRMVESDIDVIFNRLIQRLEEAPRASADSTRNIVDNFNNAIFRLQVAIGDEFLPLVTDAARALTTFISQNGATIVAGVRQIAESIRNLELTFSDLGRIINLIFSVALFGKVTGFFITLTRSLGRLGAFVRAAGGGFGGFVRHIRNVIAAAGAAIRPLGIVGQVLGFITRSAVAASGIFTGLAAVFLFFDIRRIVLQLLGFSENARQAARDSEAFRDSLSGVATRLFGIAEASKEAAQELEAVPDAFRRNAITRLSSELNQIEQQIVNISPLENLDVSAIGRQRAIIRGLESDIARGAPGGEALISDLREARVTLAEIIRLFGRRFEIVRDLRDIEREINDNARANQRTVESENSVRLRNLQIQRDAALAIRSNIASNLMLENSAERLEELDAQIKQLNEDINQLLQQQAALQRNVTDEVQDQLSFLRNIETVSESISRRSAERRGRPVEFGRRPVGAVSDPRGTDVTERSLVAIERNTGNQFDALRLLQNALDNVVRLPVFREERRRAFEEQFGEQAAEARFPSRVVVPSVVDESRDQPFLRGAAIPFTIRLRVLARDINEAFVTTAASIRARTLPEIFRFSRGLGEVGQILDAASQKIRDNTSARNRQLEEEAARIEQIRRQRSERIVGIGVTALTDIANIPGQVRGINQRGQQRLQQVQIDRQRDLDRINRDATLSAQQRAERIEEIERQSAQRRIDIERQVNREKGQAYTGFINNAIRGTAELIRQELQAAAIRAAANQISTGVSTFLAPALAGIGTGGSIGLALAAVAGLQLLGSALENRTFHFAQADREAFLAGRESATARLNVRQNAEDFSQNFVRGERSVEGGTAQSPLTIQVNAVNFQTDEALAENYVRLGDLMDAGIVVERRG